MWLVQTQQKQEMSSLSLNFILQAWIQVIQPFHSRRKELERAERMESDAGKMSLDAVRMG